MLRDSRNHPRHDLPACPAPRAYVVASTPRTGSTLLCRMLWETGLAGAPKEYLNPVQIRDWSIRRGRHHYRLLRGPSRGLLNLVPWSDGGLAAHLAHIQARRSAGGWFGLKIHAHHHRRIFARRRLADFLGPVTWIRIHRADRLGQAISWARALQTGQWAAGEPRRLPPLYCRRLIARCLAQIEAGEAHWDRFFAREPLALRLSYESLVAQPEAFSAVLGVLGISAARPSVMGRQADTHSARWRERFCAGR